jgi:micrococcal nuclease
MRRAVDRSSFMRRLDRRRQRARRKSAVAVALVAALGAAIGLAAAERGAPDVTAAAPDDRSVVVRPFTVCHTGGGTNCVVDGDTVWVDGVKIRVLDIDAPETHPPRCPREADLGERATQRLAELLNAGPFELVVDGRDTDRYGRQLRRIERDGVSLGDVLVREGLARPYGSGRRSWC